MTLSDDREVDALRRLLDAGFKPAMIVRTISQEEVESKLPRLYWDQVVKALPLMRSDGEKRMFYFTTPESEELANRLAEEGRRVIGYSLCVYCSAIGSDVTDGGALDLKKTIEKLVEQTGWDVRQSAHPSVFEVHFEITGDDMVLVDQRTAEVDQVALALSLHNRLGFHVASRSVHPIFAAQPLKIVVGLQVRRPQVPEASAYARVAILEGDERRFAAALALRELYSQVTPGTQLIIGWATLEDLFPSVPQHVVDNETVLELIDLVSAHPALIEDQKARDRIVKMLTDPQFLPKENRNERLAAAIAPVLRDDRESVYQHIRDISRARGKVAHTSPQDGNLRDHIAFIERVLLAVLDSVELSPP